MTPATATSIVSASMLHILQHSLGVDAHGRGRQYRNHFVTGPGSSDHGDCCVLAELGLMTRRKVSALSGGDYIFTVTPKGVEYVALNSPAPPPEPKLTRSQKRYREWLDADPGYSFAEWLGVPRSGRRYG
jgi:hypothetical protein